MGKNLRKGPCQGGSYGRCACLLRSEFSMKDLVLTMLVVLSVASCDGAGGCNQPCEPAEAICSQEQPDAVVELKCNYVGSVPQLTVVAVHHRFGGPASQYSVGNQITPLNDADWLLKSSTCDSLATVHGKVVDLRASLLSDTVRRLNTHKSPPVPKDKAIAALLAPPGACRLLMEASAELGWPCSPDDPCRHSQR